MYFVLLAASLALLYVQASDDVGGWSYDGKTGPDYWKDLGDHGKNKCGGKRQSPIDIVSYKAKRKNMEKFKFVNYDKPITNSEVSITTTSAGYTKLDGVERSITGGTLNDKYILAGFHVHFGNNSFQGSEHTVNGGSYPMELHLVHYKASYGSVAGAVEHGDGLAVLGVFFKETLFSSNRAANLITDHFTNAVEGKNVISGSKLTLADLISSPGRFYHYEGSLTTPWCNEAVQWFVFRDAVDINWRDMKAIRGIKDHAGTKLSHNFRPVSPLEGRKVYYV